MTDDEQLAYMKRIKALALSPGATLRLQLLTIVISFLESDGPSQLSREWLESELSRLAALPESERDVLFPPPAPSGQA